MKTHRWQTVIVFLGVLCILTAPFSVKAAEKIIKLKYAHFLPTQHAGALLSKQWCDEVEKRSKGRVKFTYLPGSTLVPAAQGYEAAVRGIADISVACPSWTAGRFPLSEVLELPLGYTNALQGTRLANEWYKK